MRKRHTCSRPGKKYNVWKLIDLIEASNQEMILVETSKFKVSRSKRSGFTKERYTAADLKYPILILWDYERNSWDVIDGRHRVCRHQDEGIPLVKSIVITQEFLTLSEI